MQQEAVTLAQARHIQSELSDNAQNQLHKAALEFGDHDGYYSMMNIVTTMSAAADFASRAAIDSKGPSGPMNWEKHMVNGGAEQFSRE